MRGAGTACARGLHGCLFLAPKIPCLAPLPTIGTGYREPEPGPRPATTIPDYPLPTRATSMVLHACSLIRSAGSSFEAIFAKRRRLLLERAHKNETTKSMGLKDIKEFSAEEVGLWLTVQGLGAKAESFIAEGVDGELLLALSEEEFKNDLGLSGLQTKKLMKNIAFTKELVEDADGEFKILM